MTGRNGPVLYKGPSVLNSEPIVVIATGLQTARRHASLQVARAALAGLPVRLGTYGDPAAVPTVVWQTVLAQSAMHTGYTHQWRTCDQTLAHWCMAGPPGGQARLR